MFHNIYYANDGAEGSRHWDWEKNERGAATATGLSGHSHQGAALPPRLPDVGSPVPPNETVDGGGGLLHPPLPDTDQTRSRLRAIGTSGSRLGHMGSEPRRCSDLDGASLPCPAAPGTISLA